MLTVPARRQRVAPSPPQLVDVVRARRVSPHVRRLTLAGEGLLGAPRLGADAFLRLFLARPDQAQPTLPGGSDDWWQEMLAMPPQVRPVLRNYTVRHADPGRGQVDIDVVLHDGQGPGTRWARNARPGDRVGLLLQGRHHAPPPGTDWQLLVGDETALPAIAAVLEAAPSGTVLHAIVEVPSPADVPQVATRADAHVSWLPRSGAPCRPGQLALRCLREHPLPPGTGYAWLAGEAASVRAHVAICVPSASRAVTSTPAATGGWAPPPTPSGDRAATAALWSYSG